MILYGAIIEAISAASFWLFGYWWMASLILFIVGTPFAIVSIALGFGLWKGKNWARNITIVLTYFEIMLVVFSVIGINTIIPFPFSLQLYGVYSLITILYTIGKDMLSLYYLSTPNTKAYFGQIQK